MGEPIPEHGSGPIRAEYRPLLPDRISVKQCWFFHIFLVMKPSFLPNDAKRPA